MALVFSAVAGFGSALSLHLHASLRTGMDLAIFDQAVRALSQGEAPVSAIKGGMNLWGDHFHPAIVLLAPLYWVFDDPRALLVAQAVMVAAAAAILVRSGQQTLGKHGGRADGTAVTSGLCLGASMGVQGALSFDFHEVALAAVPLALSMASLIAHRWTAAVWWSLPLVLVKEDMGLYVIGIALVLAWYRQWRRAVSLAVLALVWTFAVVRLVIPAIAGHAWTYAGGLTRGPLELSAAFGSSLVSAHGIGLTAVALLLACGFWALRSPLVLVALPITLARSVAGGHLASLGFHYDLLAQIICFFATVDALGRIDSRRTGTAMRFMSVVAIFSLVFGPFSWRLVTSSHDGHRPSQAADALAVVPLKAPVGVDPSLAAHASPDHPITQVVGPSELVSEALVADWVVLDQRSRHFGGAGWVEPRVRELGSLGFEPVRTAGDFVVLHRR
ncbi:DUF2079 domain-containing protein [Luteococcus sanguinis]|uniref:DUF2079 domain-containing protein n=1 Tax=Luteococcus sanguinis TaxID=174038 RepID=UPI0033709EE0